MSGDYIDYYAVSNYIRLTDIYFEEIHDSPVVKVSLSWKNQDNREVVYVRCFFNVISNLNEMLKEANMIASLVLAKISFVHDNVTFGPLEFIHASQNNNIVTTSDLVSSGGVRVLLDPARLENLNLNTDHLLLYRYANLIDNDTLQFIHLYSILDSIVTEKSGKRGQLGNDVIIYQWQSRNGIPTIWKKSLDTTKHNPETLYTWLRNQVGHAEKQSYANDVYIRISLCLTDLRNIVKWVINEYNNLIPSFFSLAFDEYNNDKQNLISNLEL